jgi:hypothetical protein
MLSRPVEAVLKKAAKSTQRVISNYSATLTEVFRAFPQLPGKFQGVIEKARGPPTPVMEAFTQNTFPHVAAAIRQSDPKLSGFGSRTSVQTKFLS